MRKMDEQIDGKEGRREEGADWCLKSSVCPDDDDEGDPGTAVMTTRRTVTAAMMQCEQTNIPAPTVHQALF